MLREGRISQRLHDRAVQRRQESGVRFEEALIECGVDEEQLLKSLAEMYRVQYVTSSKLASAVVPKLLSSFVPRSVAEQRQIVPVHLDRKRSVLSVVTSNPEDSEALKEVELATQVRSVRALLARPAAVTAALRRLYTGDEHAFTALQKGTAVAVPAQRAQDAVAAAPPLRPASVPPPASPGGRLEPARDSAPVGQPARSAAPAKLEVGQPARSAAPANESTGFDEDLYGEQGWSLGEVRQPARTAAPAKLEVRQPARTAAPATEWASLEIELALPESPPASPPAAEPQRAAFGAPPAASEGTFALDLPEEEIGSEWSPEHVGSERLLPPSPPAIALHGAPNDRPSPVPIVAGAHAETGDPFQPMKALVSLLEAERRHLRGHSLQTSELVRKVCEAFEMSAERTRFAAIAGLVHDIGKTRSGHHLTAYNVAELERARVTARRLYDAPARLLKSARLPAEALDAVGSMYERHDGTGFPAGLKGSAIPLESRIVALCDSYVDLTQTVHKPPSRILSAQDAMRELQRLEGTVFEPGSVDRLSRVVQSDELLRRLGSGRGTVVLVEPNIEDATLFELALIEENLDVHVAATVDEAIALLGMSKGVDLVVSELALSAGSGLELLANVLARRQAPAFVFLSHETDSKKVGDALGAGADDYLTKPLSAEDLAKLLQRVEQTRGARRLSEARR